MNDLALASIPGFFGLPGGGLAKPFGVHTSGLIPRDLVPQHVAILGGDHTIVESDAAGPTPTVIPMAAEPAPPHRGETRRGPLGLVAGSRSGDKGGNANLGLFVRSAEAYAWLDDLLTIDKLRELMPEAAQLEVQRFALPNIWSINFLIHGILQRGVA